MADDKHYKTVRGKIVHRYISKNNQLFVEVDLEEAPNNHKVYSLLNTDTFRYKEGDSVLGYFIQTDYQTHRHKFYVTDNVNDRMYLEDYVNLVKSVVVSRINRETTLFSFPIDKMTVEDLSSDSRKKELVLARRIAMKFLTDNLGKQADEKRIAAYFDRDRTLSYYHLRKIDELYSLYTQIRTIMDDIKIELDKVEFNLRKPVQKEEEVFTFLDNY